MEINAPHWQYYLDNMGAWVDCALELQRGFRLRLAPLVARRRYEPVLK